MSAARSGSARLDPVAFAMAAATAVVAWGLDAWMIVHGVLKVERSNADPLALHRSLRDGVLVLTAPATSPADGLYHLPFQLLFAALPALEDAAWVTSAGYHLVGLALGVGVARRLGAGSGLVAWLVFTTSPVTPILSKHVIATYFVPAAAAAFTLAVLDLAAPGDAAARRNALGRALLAWAVLTSLHAAHVVWGLPLLAGVWRFGFPGVPWRWLSAAAAVWLFRVAKAVTVGGWAPTLEWRWSSAWQAYDRLFAVEFGTWLLAPPHALPLLVGPVAVGAALWRASRGQGVPGLAPLLLVGPLLLWAEPEATVSWQVPLAVAYGTLLGATPARVRSTALWSLVASASLAAAFASTAMVGGGSFLSLASLAHRRALADVLRDDVGLRAEEIDQLRLRHHAEDGGLPATAAGLVPVLLERGPLPPGGSRCVDVGDTPVSLPGDASDVQRWTALGLSVAAWRSEQPCPGNVRHHPGAVLWWDMEAGGVHISDPTSR